MAQVLEWKGASRPGRKEDIEVLLIGDSMIRNINCAKFKQKAWLFAYPGITAEGLRAQIQNENLPPPTKIGVIYMHVGTNNVSTLRETKSVATSIHEVQGCISVVRKVYASAVLIVGSVLPRMDDQNARGVDLNKAIETYCVDAGDLSLHFVQFEKEFSIESNPRHLDLYRFKETAKSENPDTVHLNYKGVQKLQGLIEAEVSKAVKIKSGRAIKNTGDLMSNEEWVRYRELSRNNRFKARFKVTNYKPGANPRDIFVGDEQNGDQIAEQDQSAIVDMELESDEEGKELKKPLPDIIPQMAEKKRRSDSESPLVSRRNSRSPTRRRRPSGDGDVSSFTDPSDREHSKRQKSEKWTPIQSIQHKQIQAKVKKSVRERSSRRGREMDSRQSSSSPERGSIHSDSKSFRSRRSSRGSSNHERTNDRSPAKNRRRERDSTRREEKSTSLIDEISRELLSEKRKRSRNVSEKGGKRRGRSRERSESRGKKSKRGKRKESEASIDVAARIRNISNEESRKDRKARKVSDDVDDKVYGIELKRRPSMVSEASDKIFEDFLKEDKKRPRESKKPKIDKTKIIGVENDLKAKLLAKQQAREKKSKTMSFTSDFFMRLFHNIGIKEKEHQSEISAKFANSNFSPSPKNFKSISIFDFGVKFGVKLQYRSLIKAITSDHIKCAMSKTDDLRENVLIQTSELVDSDLSDSQF